jgi:hypothetical protein
MQGRPAKLKLKTWRGKGFAEKPPSPQRNPFMYCNKRTYAAEKGIVHTNQRAVARKWFPKARLLLFHGSRTLHWGWQLAPAGKGSTYHGRMLSGNSQGAPPGSRGEGSIIASMAASRISRWGEGLAKGLGIDACQRSSCWRSATAVGGTETG